MHASDASSDALDVAKTNASRSALAVRFHQGVWLTGVEQQFDAIVSNPPYIAAADPHLQDLTHEPLQALASGADGLTDLRAIIPAAPRCLRPGGWLLLEHGYDQAEAVRALLVDAGFTQVQSRRRMSLQMQALLYMLAVGTAHRTEVLRRWLKVQSIHGTQQGLERGRHRMPLSRPTPKQVPTPSGDTSSMKAHAWAFPPALLAWVDRSSKL